MGELEEKETSAAESAPVQQDVADVEPTETDKMLEHKDEKPKSPGADSKKKTPNSSKPSTPVGDKKSSTPPSPTEKPKSGEEIIDIPEAKDDAKPQESTDEKKISTEEREVKPKKIPIGGLKLPGFFMKSKPKNEADDAEGGELLEKEKKEDAKTDEESKEKKDEKPRSNFGERLRNFFVRKPAAEKQQAADNKSAANGDADTKSEATAEASPAEGEAPTQPTQKRGLLNAIKLPIANMMPKRKSNQDVEMGLGKAGLASMETLDDSLKDQDCVDKAPAKNNGTDDVAKLKKSPSGEIKQASDEKSPTEPDAPMSFMERLRAYRCSVDDALIALGILLFVLLISVIGYVLSHETLTSPPIRDGKYIDAVTTCGLVEGLKEDSAFAFRGIPYAVPPKDEYRWTAAQKIENINDCWNGTLKAHESGQICSQRLENGTIVGDEDCLYLDVITPHVRYNNPLPVVVLIGADTLTGPSPNILRPSARYSNSHDVLFVRPNFRLGVFGFMALEALTKSTTPRTSGNYALTDIIAALEWIQLNIVHFGGDPKQVILLGHRAGATLVSALVTSKKADKLYSRAWVSSPSGIFPGKSLTESEKRNEEFLRTIECTDVECLRSLTAEHLWAATPDNWFNNQNGIPAENEVSSSERHEWLVLDGIILQQHPADIWKEEKTGKPRLVIGTTAHANIDEKLRETNWTAETIRSFIQASRIGALNLTDEAIKRYNITDHRGLLSMISDIRTVCPLLANARLQPTVPFYVATQGEGEDQLVNVDADVQAILGRYEPHTVEQRRFMASMQQLFFYYVSHGTVPQFDAHKRVINLGQDPLAQEDYSHCNFWISHDIVPRYARVD